MRGIPLYTLVWGVRYTLGARYLSKNTVIPQYCSFSKAQHTLPEDGPIGPKHRDILTVVFNILSF